MYSGNVSLLNGRRIDPFTTENLGTLSTDFMNKKYGKRNVFN